MKIYFQSTLDTHPSRQSVQQAYLSDETQTVRALLPAAQLSAEQASAVADKARHLIVRTREQSKEIGGIEALLREYDLSSQEGVALMCLAEALLRIPDADTADRLIKDKLNKADWGKHLGQSHSLFVNASTWGLMLTGTLVRFEQDDMNNVLNRLLARGSEPVIRLAIQESMGIIGQQFVMGETIEAAIKRSQTGRHRDYLFSFDMLGEAALTQPDAQRYLQRYLHAIEALAKSLRNTGNEWEAPGISIKLSALHPRFELSQRERMMKELVPDVLTIARLARDAGLNITIDAEEADRLDVTLDVFAAVFNDASLANWQGLGLALQAYQKRALPVIRWLQELARDRGRRIMLRLVKGAYWDTEIKRAQEQGLEGYPVFTRKVLTDLSYQACAKCILAAGDSFYPQFATHNAYTIALIQTLVQPSQAFEFQRLHGMGRAVYREVLQSGDIKCRVYAPVGNHADLLPYLVRRLLENGANTSFVNRIENEQLPVDELINDPVEQVQALPHIPHPGIPRPRHLYGEARLNSKGLNFYDTATLQGLEQIFTGLAVKQWHAAPHINGKPGQGDSQPVLCPADPSQVLGYVVQAGPQDVAHALTVAQDYFATWSNQSVEARAALVERAGHALEQHREELMVLCVREGGRCLKDAAAEVREAIDYCRYYAQQARETLSPRPLLGPTGESNTLLTHGRGVVVCISPWNFPVAIFTGQIVAALLAGNTVIAKPAHQTPLTAMRVVQLLHEAGIPPNALALLPGKSGVISKPLLEDSRVAGVVFTGSTTAAHSINRTLASRPGPIAPLIAETGGQNAMIMDSSALPEQVVTDVIASAFNSAGQRCSALRVLFLQTDIAPRVLELLAGAMAQLRLGDPLLLSTDVGPLIDADSKTAVTTHIEHLGNSAKPVCRAPLDKTLRQGNYFAPTVLEIQSLAQLQEEVFGPVLHVLRYKAGDLDNVIAAINNTGFGLTLGIHSRIEAKADYIAQRVRAGNVYVNRNMIGAVVGVQPFGGEGLSGTGPKAGGPHYLLRLVSEQTVTVNTAAIGGNAALLNLE